MIESSSGAKGAELMPDKKLELTDTQLAVLRKITERYINRAQEDIEDEFVDYLEGDVDLDWESDEVTEFISSEIDKAVANWLGE
jgi:hypothetical protein